MPLYPREGDPAPIVVETEWVPGPVWMGQISRNHRRSNSDCPSRSDSQYQGRSGWLWRRDKSHATTGVPTPTVQAVASRNTEYALPAPSKEHEFHTNSIVGRHGRNNITLKSYYTVHRNLMPIWINENKSLFQNTNIMFYGPLASPSLITSVEVAYCYKRLRTTGFD